MRFKSKVAVVTGGSSGIGRATAELFAAEGAYVIVVDIAGEGSLSTVKHIEDSGGTALFLEGNVTKPEDLRSAVSEAHERFGRIDVLVNSAGVSGRGTATDTGEQEWERVIGINLTGTFLASKYVIPYMISGGAGAIVNIASGFGVVPAPDSVAYSASKGGVVALTKAMALDYLNANIRINCVAPGAVDTPLLREHMHGPSTGLANLFGGRIATPVEIGRGILFLASEDASYITGAILPIDGGATAGYKRSHM